jgi:hypothetical protein
MQEMRVNCIDGLQDQANIWQIAMVIGLAAVEMVRQKIDGQFRSLPG